MIQRATHVFLFAVIIFCRVDAAAVILPISAMRSSGNRWLTAARHMASFLQAKGKVKGKEYDKNALSYILLRLSNPCRKTYRVILVFLVDFDINL